MEGGGGDDLDSLTNLTSISFTIAGMNSPGSSARNPLLSYLQERKLAGVDREETSC